MSTTDVVVRLEGVTKVYQQDSVAVHALAGINLEIQKRDFAVLVGPSGSGKTTLLNMIGGLDSPTSGSIWVGGEDIGHMSRSQLSRLRLREIGFVFQEFNLIPVLSALENVEFIMLLQGVPESERRRRSLSLLQELGLEGLEHRRPNELSGGQQQRVAVARALAAQPRLVLADEPTANLDSETAHTIIALMKKMRDEVGTTFLFATHDTRIIGAAEIVYTIEDGRLTGRQERGS